MGKALDELNNYKKSDSDKAKSALSDVISWGDVGGLWGDNTFGGDDSEKRAALEKAAALEIQQEGLDFVKDAAKDNRADWQNLDWKINGSPSGYTDEQGRPTSPQAIEEAKAKVAEYEAQKAEYEKQTQAAGATEGAYSAPAGAVGVNWTEAGPVYVDANGTPLGPADAPGVGINAGTSGAATPPKAPAALDPRILEIANGTATAVDKSQTYGGKLAGFQDEDQGVVDRLKEALSQYKNPAEAFNDPNFMAYVGDLESQAKVSQEAIGNQKKALGRWDELSHPQETAEEKLIREMARREMEGSMKGNREAMAQNLKARGVYGSGAELASQLDTQQEAASRRSLEEMGANANASKRAIDALGHYSDVSNQIRGNELAEGQALDTVGMFNKQVKQGADLARAKAKIEAETNAEQEKAKRATTTYDAESRAIGNKRADLGNETNTNIALTSGKTGNNLAGASLVVPQINNLSDTYRGNAAFTEANAPADGILGGLLPKKKSNW